MNTEHAYTLTDLRQWSCGPAAALIGWPVSHSRSPRMHNALPSSVRYHKFELLEHELEEALRLFHDHGFIGLNVTAPYKIAVIPLLVGLSTEAAQIGAVNTLVRTDEGWSGHNTDGRGLVRAIERQYGWLNAVHRPVMVLGTGGVASAAVSALSDYGCEQVTVVGRDRAKADTLVRRLNSTHVRCGEVGDVLPASLIVNCTSLGMKVEDRSPFPQALLSKWMNVFDTVYADHQTALVREAGEKKVGACDGRTMLVEQGLLAQELWTGIPPTEARRRRMTEAVR